MTHKYTVTGMTCDNCKASVKKNLLAVAGVEKVSVDLKTSLVGITMSQHVSIKTFETALPEKYTIEAERPKNVLTPSREEKTSKKSDLQQLFPLFLILLFISGVSILLNYKSWRLNQVMLDFMGLFLVVFSFFKLLDLKGFPESFRMYDPLAKLVPAYGWLYPFLELSLGLLFLMRIQIPLALIITLIVLGITTIGVAKSLMRKTSISCACLGTALKLPMTKATLIENVIMITMAITMLSKIYF